jgi:hypothetical protein
MTGKLDRAAFESCRGNSDFTCLIGLKRHSHYMFGDEQVPNDSWE